MEHDWFNNACPPLVKFNLSIFFLANEFFPIEEDL